MSNNKIKIGKDFDIYIDLDTQELIIEGRGDVPVMIRIPVEYVGGYGQAKTKKEKPPLIDIIKRKVLKSK